MTTKFKFNNLLKPLTTEELIKAKRYFVLGICQIAVFTFALCIYDSFYKTRIGVVNITGIVDEFIKVQAQSGISPDELKKRVQTFGRSLEKGLHDVGAKEHVVLMPAEAVITGAKDYTQEIQNYLTKIVPKASLKVEPQQAQSFKQTDASMVPTEKSEKK